MSQVIRIVYSYGEYMGEKGKSRHYGNETGISSYTLLGKYIERDASRKRSSHVVYAVITLLQAIRKVFWAISADISIGRVAMIVKITLSTHQF